MVLCRAVLQVSGSQLAAASQAWASGDSGLKAQMLEQVVLPVLAMNGDRLPVSVFTACEYHSKL